MSGLKRYLRSTWEVRVQRIAESPCTLRVDSPEAALAYWREKIEKAAWYDPERECCAVILVNTRYVAIGHAMVSVGSLNESVVHPRETLRPAVVLAAYAILVGHNHPSGDPSPSEADHRLTRRIVDAGALLQIPLLDHLIVGRAEGDRPGYFSFREAGLV